MLKRSLLTLVCALLLAAGFGYGLVRFFVLRYSSGDIYPAYSTLRSDPLGTKVLHDALADLPGSDVRRNFQPLPKLKPLAPVTLVYAGVSHFAIWDDAELRAFDALVIAGSRAVFAFRPFEKRSEAEEKREEEAEKKRDAADAKKAGEKKELPKKKGADEKDRFAFAFKEVAKRWGFTFAQFPFAREKLFQRRAQAVAPGLEPEIAWHSGLYFDALKPHWKVLYECEKHPVLIERPYGDGSIVLAADSFFLSNEAIRSDRHAQLLARIFSGPREMVFDEEHLGLSETPGIASLARKYRLHGVIAGLLLIAVLFVWKNAVRFIPPHAETRGNGEVLVGKESAHGLVNLLQRSIPPREILATCAAEWRKAFGQQRTRAAKFERALAERETAPPAARGPVADYTAIAQALQRRE